MFSFSSLFYGGCIGPMSGIGLGPQPGALVCHSISPVLHKKEPVTWAQFGPAIKSATVHYYERIYTEAGHFEDAENRANEKKSKTEMRRGPLNSRDLFSRCCTNILLRQSRCAHCLVPPSDAEPRTSFFPFFFLYSPLLPPQTDPRHRSLIEPFK